MNEDTIVKILPLPHGQDWAWHADANVIVLSDCLDDAGRDAALCDLQAQWRRSGLRVVPEYAELPLPIPLPPQQTMPIALPPTPLLAAGG